MTDTDPIISIDGVKHPLSAYPQAHRDFQAYFGIEESDAQAEDLEDLGLAPAEAYQMIAREYEHDKVVIDGRIAQAHVVGRVYEAAIAVGPVGVECSNGVRDRQGAIVLDDAIQERMSWLLWHGGSTMWWRRADTGDGILLDDTIYMVAFSDPGVEQAYLARFPEVRP